jgi:hypothetical protein
MSNLECKNCIYSVEKTFSDFDLVDREMVFKRVKDLECRRFPKFFSKFPFKMETCGEYREQ